MIYTLTLNPAVDRELTVPAIEYDSVMRASAARIDLGGKGFNVSRLLKSMGTPSTAVGFLGGRSGELLQDGLSRLGIQTDFVWIPGETRTNISIVTHSHDRYLKVNEKGPLVEPEMQQELLEKIAGLTRPGDWWVLAGSLPPGVTDDFYARIIRLVNSLQSQAILDTSGEPLRLGCAESPYLVKPNTVEAWEITGLPVTGTEEIVRSAGEIRRIGARNVVISFGKNGALLQTGEGTWLANSPDIEEINPIGAGDALVGGLVWGLSQGMTLCQCLAWGVASGAATASLGGTEVGSRELIERLHRQVQVETIIIER